VGQIQPTPSACQGRWHVACGRPQGRVGRNVLAGPMVDNGPWGLRHSAVMALQPAVAQRRSPMADGEERSSAGEEKGKTGGGPTKNGV
jgi:hypothetical protein